MNGSPCTGTVVHVLNVPVLLYNHALKLELRPAQLDVMPTNICTATSITFRPYKLLPKHTPLSARKQSKMASPGAPASANAFVNACTSRSPPWGEFTRVATATEISIWSSFMSAQRRVRTSESLQCLAVAVLNQQARVILERKSNAPPDSAMEVYSDVKPVCISGGSINPSPLRSNAPKQTRIRSCFVAVGAIELSPRTNCASVTD